MLKRILLTGLALAALIIGVSACHTVHGAGEDISSAGQKIQENTPP
ncbi:MAG TPA: entericidin A/B family lipoprotein [Verrucomicrobiae bacterium]|nr:entericidin A/B family lipoprotein [Verrucomicrobiae bacterium]